ncbi:hypothetical protein DSL72_002568 [Monilinia vaccinii-corymbosi]|uniref:Hydrophobin n=1 Tax=Monilinia vaccinii-corymbosi TaxID=61207 RepID=A0A8A3PD10_9HELO|nr:hypothetical protein DSL72_002568 [Monilinia vaccinii-corymbosi]
MPSPLSFDSSGQIEKRQASKFCTIIGFTNPYCCIPQAEVGNIVFLGSSCEEVPGGAAITTIQQFSSTCNALNKIPLCCNLNINGAATCSAAIQY